MCSRALIRVYICPHDLQKTRSLFVESSTGMVDISLILYIDKFAMNNLESNPFRHFPLI